MCAWVMAALHLTTPSRVFTRTSYIRYYFAEIELRQLAALHVKEPQRSAVCPYGTEAVPQQDDTVCAALERGAHQLGALLDGQLALYAYRRRQHDGEGVVVYVLGLAGHVDAAYDLAVGAVYGSGGAGPAVVSAAVVLCADHLYCDVRIKGDAYGVCADALVVPQRA